MLDILDGRAAAVTDKVIFIHTLCSENISTNDIVKVSQSITDGLKALRGDGDSKDKDRASGRSSDRDRHRERDRDRDSESRVPQSGFGT